MDLEHLGAFLGAFSGALIATPFWFRQLMRRIERLQSCAHCHNDCPSILPIKACEEEQ